MSGYSQNYLIPSVLPVLCKTHPELFGNDVPIDNIVERLDKPPIAVGWKSNNSMTASELALRLIDYYSTFDPSRNAIIIEHGVEVQRKQSSAEPQLKLIDPYSPVTVCRSTNAAKALMTAVDFVKDYMYDGMFIDTFPEFPEATIFRKKTENARWRIGV
uniref:Glyco_hydro_18 domain-containing protein n=1 Tax=Heterorhabditis bacteriophora TaxID=37862 RepID=A0A1I7XEK8_HETBA